ncbi:hypothetical protein MTO96_014530 [Rhipicephalus appendiculatus]
MCIHEVRKNGLKDELEEVRNSSACLTSCKQWFSAHPRDRIADDDEAAKDSAERPTERAGSLLRPPDAEALQVVVPPRRPSWKDPGSRGPRRRVLELSASQSFMKRSRP